MSSWQSAHRGIPLHPTCYVWHNSGSLYPSHHRTTQFGIGITWQCRYANYPDHEQSTDILPDTNLLTAGSQYHHDDPQQGYFSLESRRLVHEWKTSFDTDWEYDSLRHPMKVSVVLLLQLVESDRTQIPIAVSWVVPWWTLSFFQWRSSFWIRNRSRVEDGWWWWWWLIPVRFDPIRWPTHMTRTHTHNTYRYRFIVRSFDVLSCVVRVSKERLLQTVFTWLIYVYNSIDASVPVLLLSLKYISNLRDVVVVVGVRHSAYGSRSAHFSAAGIFHSLHTWCRPTNVPVLQCYQHRLSMTHSTMWRPFISYRYWNQVLRVTPVEARMSATTYFDLCDRKRARVLFFLCYCANILAKVLRHTDKRFLVIATRESESFVQCPSK